MMELSKEGWTKLVSASFGEVGGPIVFHNNPQFQFRDVANDYTYGPSLKKKLISNYVSQTGGVRKA